MVRAMNKWNSAVRWMRWIPAGLVLCASAPATPPQSNDKPEKPELRQFDFWVGTWDVYSPSGQKVGTNRIEKLERGYLLLENWASVGNSTGKSMNYYDASEKKWKQLWVDAGGDIIKTAGRFERGAMRLRGEHIFKTGKKRPFKLTFTPNADGSVRQLCEESTDGGKTFKTWFDGKYVRAAKKHGDKSKP